MFHKAAADILWLESLPTRILGGTVTIMWLGRVIPHSYIPRPLLYHTLYQHQNQCKKWSIGVLWNMGLKSQNTWGTHTWVLKVTWVRVAFCLGSTAGSGQGPIKVLSRAKQRNYWIETLFTVSMYFLVIGSHIVLDFQMTLKRKITHSTEFSVFKLVEDEILHKTLVLFCQMLKIQDGRDGKHLGFDL